MHYAFKLLSRWQQHQAQSLIRAAQQYASANNLIASFAIHHQSGKIVKINVGLYLRIQIWGRDFWLNLSRQSTM